MFAQVYYYYYAAGQHDEDKLAKRMPRPESHGLVTPVRPSTTNSIILIVVVAKLLSALPQARFVTNRRGFVHNHPVRITKILKAQCIFTAYYQIEYAPPSPPRAYTSSARIESRTSKEGTSAEERTNKGNCT